MCLTIDRTKHQKIDGKYIPFVAKEDIMVYKLVNDPNNDSYYEAPYQCGYIYDSPILEADLVIDPYWPEVDNGIHAFTNLDRAKVLKYETAVIPNPRIIECVIPKGSQYFYGRKEDIVTNCLIFWEELKN
jgi:DNA polymerase II large subunit